MSNPEEAKKYLTNSLAQQMPKENAQEIAEMVDYLISERVKEDE